jgi:uncharacterized protein (DUF2147 family)
MRRTVVITAAVLSLTAGAALAADPAEGVWLVQDKDARVRIGPCPGQAGQLCGEIVWLRAPTSADGQPKTDARNPDAALRDRPLIGLTMIRGFRPAGPGRWEGGKIYDPKSGKTYASKLRATQDGKLKVDGCVLMICKTQTWTQAD